MSRIKRVNEIFLVTIAAAVLTSFFIGMIGAILGAAGIKIDELATLLLSQAVFFLPTAVYLRENKFDFKETIRLRRIKLSTVLMLAGFMYLLMPAATWVNAVSMQFTTNVIDSTVTEIAEKYPPAVGILAVAFIPAVLEESVYRGVFFNEYRKLNPQKAVVLSGLLFGLTHMNLNQFVYAFLLGMVFSVVVEVTDSIVSSMVLHFVMNGTSMLTVYAQKLLVGAEEAAALETADTTATVDAYIRSGWPMAVCGLLLAYLLLKLIAVNEGRGEVLSALFQKKRKEEKKEPLFTVALWFRIAICIGIMLLVEVTG